MQTPSEQPILAQPNADLALCRATIYAALALGFRPPTQETVDRLVRSEGAAALADAARMLEGIDGTAAGLSVRAVALTRPDADLAMLTTDHGRLFGHTASGAAPAYETEYGSEALFQQPQEMGDLAGFMRAFGLTVRPEVHERVDHVSCECEFMSFLAFKEAYAIGKGDQEMLAATSHATMLFLRDHLARFAPAFERRLAKADSNGFYSALGRLLIAMVNFDCQRLGVPAGPEHLSLRPDPAAYSAPMGCGNETETEGGGCGGVCPS